MATIVKPNTFSSGATIVASEHNSNFDTIYNDYNGNITNANLSATAGIVGSKITSLASIASAAGYLPAINAIISTGNFASTGSATIMMASASAMTSHGWAIIRFSSGNTGFVPYFVGVSS